MSKKNLLKNRRKWTRSDKLNFGSQAAGSSCSSSLQEQPVAAGDPAAAGGGPPPPSARCTSRRSRFGRQRSPARASFGPHGDADGGQQERPGVRGTSASRRSVGDPFRPSRGSARAWTQRRSLRAWRPTGHRVTGPSARSNGLFFKHYFTLFHFCSFRSLWAQSQ